jgi:hypothetical protein
VIMGHVPDRPTVFRENPWVIGLYLSAIVIFSLAFWGPYSDTGIFAFMGSWRVFWGVAYTLSLAYVTIEALTRRVTIADGRITVKSLAMTQQMQINDLAYWRPWGPGLPYGFLIWSIRGEKLKIYPFIDRPKDLERILRAVASEKPS